MKFLAQSSRVKKELKSWAGGHPLIFVRFFFGIRVMPNRCLSRVYIEACYLKHAGKSLI
ncbi:hypothetical protein BDV12DRAFT_175629 [Aspergillus spectabilis]